MTGKMLRIWRLMERKRNLKLDGEPENLKLDGEDAEDLETDRDEEEPAA